MQRTELSERFAENFVGLPLTAECVYRSPRYIDGKIEKEVCDHLLILRKDGIIVSLKSQDDPTKKNGDKVQNWVLKQTKKAVSQAKGAIKTIREHSFWCIHRRRGRVDFPPKSFEVKHILILVELLHDVVELPNDFPLQYDNIPITYLSVNDFYNIVNELRSFPDVSFYLNARSVLPSKTQRTIGIEKSMYSYFVLNDESFAGCHGIEDAKIVCASRENDLRNLIGKKMLEDKYANLVEYFSDSLAERLVFFKDGLDEELIAFYDDANKRSNYLEMQNELCDLRLPERRRLGRHFEEMVEKIKHDHRPTSSVYFVFFVDTKPDFVYVLVSSKNISRRSLILQVLELLHGALAYYQKAKGMAIADCNGTGFEFVLASNLTATSSDRENGKRLFSNLKIFKTPVKLVS